MVGESHYSVIAAVRTIDRPICIKHRKIHTRFE